MWTHFEIKDEFYQNLYKDGIFYTKNINKLLSITINTLHVFIYSRFIFRLLINCESNSDTIQSWGLNNTVREKEYRIDQTSQIIMFHAC